MTGLHPISSSDRGVVDDVDGVLDLAPPGVETLLGVRLPALVALLGHVAVEVELDVVQLGDVRALDVVGPAIQLVGALLSLLALLGGVTEALLDVVRGLARLLGEVPTRWATSSRDARTSSADSACETSKSSVAWAMRAHQALERSQGFHVGQPEWRTRRRPPYGPLLGFTHLYGVPTSIGLLQYSQVCGANGFDLSDAVTAWKTGRPFFVSFCSPVRLFMTGVRFGVPSSFSTGTVAYRC